MSTNQTDNKWIADFQRGDTKALKHVFNLYNKALRYFAEQIIRDSQEAEDIVAETFLKLWRRYENFDNLKNIRAFLYITTRNACFDYLQYIKRKEEKEKEMPQEAFTDDNAVSREMIQAEILNEVYREIENLPTQAKKVFKLSYIHGFTNQEIAEQLGISPFTVKNQKVRAAKLLRDKIGIMKWTLFLAYLKVMAVVG